MNALKNIEHASISKRWLKKMPLIDDDECTEKYRMVPLSRISTQLCRRIFDLVFFCRIFGNFSAGRCAEIRIYLTPRARPFPPLSRRQSGLARGVPAPPAPGRFVYLSVDQIHILAFDLGRKNHIYLTVDTEAWHEGKNGQIWGPEKSRRFNNRILLHNWQFIIFPDFSSLISWTSE